MVRIGTNAITHPITNAQIGYLYLRLYVSERDEGAEYIKIPCKSYTIYVNKVIRNNIERILALTKVNIGVKYNQQYLNHDIKG